MKDIGNMNAKISEGLSEEISKLSSSIGVTGTNSSLNSNLDALNKNIVELNKKLPTFSPMLGPGMLPNTGGVTPKPK